MSDISFRNSNSENMGTLDRNTYVQAKKTDPDLFVEKNNQPVSDLPPDKKIYDLADMRILANRSGEDFAQRMVKEINRQIEKHYSPEYGNVGKHELTPTLFRFHPNGEIEPQIDPDLMALEQDERGNRPHPAEVAEKYDVGTDSVEARGYSTMRKKDVYVVGLFYQDEPGYVYVDKGEIGHLITAAKDDMAENVYFVCPYLPFERSEKKDKSRIAIESKEFFREFDNKGVDGYFVMDLHEAAIEGQTNKGITKLKARPFLTKEVAEEIDLEEYIALSPDVGSLDRVKEYTRSIEIPHAIAAKSRDVDNKASVEGYEGANLGERNKAIIADDMFDTGGTAVENLENIRDLGYEKVKTLVTHFIGSDGALGNIKENDIDIYATDSVPHKNEVYKELEDYLTVVSIADAFGKAIYRHQCGISIGASRDLFPHGEGEN